MPTYDQDERFRHEYHRLRRAEQQLFNRAVKEFVAALKDQRPPPKKLGIERYERQSGVYEFHWSATGRALFRYGPEKTPGEPHVIWLRIGGHEIYDER
jgi:hypothetical protein